MSQTEKADNNSLHDVGSQKDQTAKTDSKDVSKSVSAAEAKTDSKDVSKSVSAAEAKPGLKNESAEKQQTEPVKEQRTRTKVLKNVSSGIAHIRATFNNTLVTITDRKGAVIAWSSAGKMRFKGTRKSTAYAATIVAQDAVRQASAYRLQDVEVRVQGPGSGRESAIRALQAAGLNITVIRDVTPIPHNGCRPRKKRRV